MKNKFLFVILSTLLLSSCSPKRQILRYIKEKDRKFVSAIYTNNTDKFKSLSSEYEILPLPKDLRLIPPYNDIIILVDTLVDTTALREDFPFARFISLKKALIIDNTLGDYTVAQLFTEYYSFFDSLGISRIYATDVEKLEEIKDRYRINLLPNKGQKDFRKKMNWIINKTKKGEFLTVYFYDADTSIYENKIQLYNNFIYNDIVSVKDGDIIMPVFAFRDDIIKDVTDSLKKYKSLKRIYTNDYYLVKKFFKDVSIAWLPFKYRKGKRDDKFYRRLANLNIWFLGNGGVIVYLMPRAGIKDTTFPSELELKRYLGDNKIKNYYNALTIYPKFLDTPSVVKVLNEKIRSDSSLVNRIYTNRPHYLKRLMDTNIRTVWEPQRCYLKDTICYEKKDFQRRIFNYKIDVDNNTAYWLHFKVKDLFFPSTELVKKFLKGRVYYEDETGIIFTSPYVNSLIFKSLEDSIIPLYDSTKDFKIYSNKIYVLKILLDTGFHYQHLPTQYLLPDYRLNEKLEAQLRKVRLEMTINNALVIYLRDPTDSVFPSERYMREKFKYFKFYNFKEGFVIGRYLGD